MKPLNPHPGSTALGALLATLVLFTLSALQPQPDWIVAEEAKRENALRVGTSLGPEAYEVSSSVDSLESAARIASSEFLLVYPIPDRVKIDATSEAWSNMERRVAIDLALKDWIPRRNDVERTLARGKEVVAELEAARERHETIEHWRTLALDAYLVASIHLGYKPELPAEPK